MKTRHIQIDRLELRLPRASAPGTQGTQWSPAKGEALARSTAASLAEALGKTTLAGHSTPVLKIMIPRRKAGAEEIARAISSALERALPAQGRES